jgi:hypothetical protein
MAEVKDNLIQLEVVYSKLNKALDENINRLNIGATAVENYNKKISVIPSEFQKSLVDIKTKTDAVTISSKKLEQQSIKESNARNALNKQREQAIAQIEKENAKLQSSENLYNKLQTKLNSLSNEYKNLAARKELGLSLTAKEEQRYISLQGRIQTYDKALKGVDASMGKYSRNVGNYAGAFNPLNNSIAQLTREAPAFANSVQTGFMAISNNLPIFFDAMQGVINQNKELQAQGKPTKSVLGQLASGLFSFQTLLSVGVTLLTIYGKEIVEWATGLSTAEKALRSFKQAQIEIQSQSVAQAKDLDKYRDVVNDTNISEKERLRALKLLKEQIPELSKVELGHADALQKVNQYTDYYIKQAAIRYKSDQFIKKAGEELIKQEEIRLKVQKQQVDVGFGDYVKGAASAMATNNLLQTSTYANVNALNRLSKEYDASVLAQKNFEKSAEIEIRQLDIVKSSRLDKSKVLKAEKDLAFDLVDVYASLFELNKLYLEREIKLYDELANSEHELLDDRIRNFNKYTDRKLQLQLLEYNESVRLNNLEYTNEVDNLRQTYIEYVKQDNVTKSQRLGAKKELNNALKALEQKKNLDLQILELKHSDSLVEINAETFEKIAKLRDLYNGLEFNKKIKDQELKDLLEHKNRLYNIDKKTTKKQLDDIGKDKKDSERKIQETILQNDIAVINKKLSNEKLGAEAELKLKTDLYDKLKALNQLEIADLEEKRKAQEDYLKLLENTYQGFINDFGGDSGFGKLLDVFSGGLDKFKDDAVATALVFSEAFQEAFNTIANASQANFDAEYARLEKQKEVALQFAGDSATAKEEIERQAEERRKGIARREAEAQKRLAIFNIVTNTAQAILATYAKLGFPAGIPASIAMGVIGAAQIALVASQEIPQFWRGTENAPEGWALTQEKGAEIITDKYGKVKSYGNDKGAQMTYLNRGDKVYNAQKSEAYINKELAKNGIMPMRQSIINNNENNSLSKEDFNNGISKLAKTFKRQQPSSNTQVFLNNKQINTDYYKGKKV